MEISRHPSVEFVSLHDAILAERYPAQPVIVVDKSKRCRTFLAPENPFFENGKAHCFVGLKNGSPVASAVVFCNPNQQGGVAHIGFIEFLDERDGTELLEYALLECVRLGYTTSRAPVDGSLWANFRLALRAGDSPFFGEPYHHESYERVFLVVGFTTVQKNISFEEPLLQSQLGKYFLTRDVLAREGIVTAQIKEAELLNHSSEIFALLKEGFPEADAMEHFDARLFGYLLNANMGNTPAHYFIAKQNDSIVGFLYAYPDPWSEKSKRYVLKSIAVSKHVRNRGVGKALFAHAYHVAKESGMTQLLFALMREGNSPISRIAGQAKALYREYAFYEYDSTSPRRPRI